MQACATMANCANSITPAPISASNLRVCRFGFIRFSLARAMSATNRGVALKYSLRVTATRWSVDLCAPLDHYVRFRTDSGMVCIYTSFITLFVRYPDMTWI